MRLADIRFHVSAGAESVNGNKRRHLPVTVPRPWPFWPGVQAVTLLHALVIAVVAFATSAGSLPTQEPLVMSKQVLL